mgnify:CR=1 FL=1
MYRPTAKSYFSGAGLMDLGMELAGVNVVQSLEIDRQSIKTLRANFHHQIIEKDITVQTVLDQPKTDTILLTFPCTKYSNAADINGTRTGDDLFLHAFRHIALEEPEAFVVENVPGMRAFPVVMEAFEKIPDYYVQIFCPVDAMEWLPQKRKRLIMIGTKKRFPVAPPQNSRRVPLKDLIDPVPDMEIPEYIKARITGNYRDKPIVSDPSDKNAVAPTCVAHYSKDRGTRMVKDHSHPLGMRPYTPREYARLQGVPDSFKFPVSNAQTYKQIGNGVAVPVATWVGKELLKYFN